MRNKKTLWNRLEKNPPLFFLTLYLTCIFISSVLLTSPLGLASGKEGNFLDSFFVSTSAICVTGLTPVVTSEQWSFLGQIIIIINIQLGGLGVATAFAAIGLIAKKQFSMADRVLLKEEKNQGGVSGIIRLTLFILKATLLIEGSGAFILCFYFIPKYGFIQGVWFSIFHAISAFCNAGFDILGPSSLEDFSSHALLILPIAFLIIIASFGFPAYADFVYKRGRGKKFSLQTKIAVSTVFLLLFFGMISIFFIERKNPETMADLPLHVQWMNALFQSTTTRTAGFASLNQAGMKEASVLICIFLMFIGGSPVGTAGGIKTTTFAAMAFGAVAELRGSEETKIFHRRLKEGTIQKAFILSFLSLIWIAVVCILLSITEKFGFLELLFETVSAFATVGLTRGVTPDLTDFGKVLIILTMLFGKIGPITMLYTFVPKERKHNYRLASEEILIG